MMLTTKGRYAVMALVDMALINRNSPIKLEEIATRQSIQLSYLEQIFLKLRKAGIVDSVRGPGGGYVLSRDMKDINIWQIIEAVNEKVKITRCNSSEGGCTTKGVKCLTHNLWNGLSNKIEEYFLNISLSDVIENKVSVNE